MHVTSISTVSQEVGVIVIEEQMEAHQSYVDSMRKTVIDDRASDHPAKETLTTS